jgi:hypothetical protein
MQALQHLPKSACTLHLLLLLLLLVMQLLTG